MPPIPPVDFKIESAVGVPSSPLLSKPSEEVPTEKQSVYDAMVASHDIEAGARKYLQPLPRGVAIVPTAVSGGGDIMCAVKLAVELRARGVTPVYVIVKEGIHKGRNSAVIDKIRHSDLAEGITIHELDSLPTSFVMPDMILAGPGANSGTESQIASELSAHMSGKSSKFGVATDATAFFAEQKTIYIQLEEPGFIAGQYKFNVDPSRQVEMSATQYGLGLPLSSGQSRPIETAFSQDPTRLLGLKSEWLKQQLLGDTPEEMATRYSGTRMLSMVYHHIDTVFERSLYTLASAASEDSRDMDIVAKVWDPSKPIGTQVAWTLIKYLEPRDPGVPAMLNKPLLEALGVAKVVMVRPDKTEELVVSTGPGKTIRIIDPFPMAADDMEILRNAAIPIQGCSGLMSISRSVELNKIPLIEVLNDNRNFFKQLLPIAEQIDPENKGLALYLKLMEALIQNVRSQEIRVFDAEKQRYVLPPVALSIEGIDRSERVTNSRGREVNKYYVAEQIQDRVLVNSDLAASAKMYRDGRPHNDPYKSPMIADSAAYLDDPVTAFQKIGELLRSPEFHRQVEQFNRFIVEECSLYDRLADKVASRLNAVIPPSPDKCVIN